MSAPARRHDDAQKLARLRAWLEYVAALAIDMLDDLDAATLELEDADLEDDDREAAA